MVRSYDPSNRSGQDCQSRTRVSVSEPLVRRPRGRVSRAVAVVALVVHGPAGPHGGAGAPAEFALRTCALGRHSWLPTHRRPVASAHFRLPVAPTRANVDGRRLPAAATTRRDPASMTPHETGLDRHAQVTHAQRRRRSRARSAPRGRPWGISATPISRTTRSGSFGP